jgi:hypothetical protein
MCVSLCPPAGRAAHPGRTDRHSGAVHGIKQPHTFLGTGSSWRGRAVDLLPATHARSLTILSVCRDDQFV